ncbi:unnamed protein product [Vicia faba]|uniref:Uncharacterized protein n=1 Tax=Vicia faba TaxID=3906 RepID=A0AAV0YTG7_VICFA|nr:unnamed protein product [Vicia faba]
MQFILAVNHALITRSCFIHQTYVPVSFEIKDTVVRAYRTDPVQVRHTSLSRTWSSKISTRVSCTLLTRVWLMRCLRKKNNWWSSSSMFSNTWVILKMRDMEIHFVSLFGKIGLLSKIKWSLPFPIPSEN